MSLTGQLLEEAGFGEDDRRLIEISVEEIFTNIASYAYKEEEGMVWIQWDIREAGEAGKEAVIRFQDEGVPYDPFARRDPDLNLPFEERPVGGLGVYMVKQFMDTASHCYEEGHNVTVIRKVVTVQTT
jgi:anti-sigma regulatory factor (Ser/Thr protein kinase)